MYVGYKDEIITLLQKIEARHHNKGRELQVRKVEASLPIGDKENYVVFKAL